MAHTSHRGLLDFRWARVEAGEMKYGTCCCSNYKGGAQGCAPMGLIVCFLVFMCMAETHTLESLAKKLCCTVQMNITLLEENVTTWDIASIKQRSGGIFLVS
ncbi:unnamed protein product [Sphacelaria rigidula]